MAWKPNSMTTMAKALRVCVLTDIEGNWKYVRNFVRQSTCLQFAAGENGEENEGELELKDDCLLVFGGDAGDKGGGTLQCYEQLVKLKKKYPERVVLLVGNRDVNKMRFTSELADSEMDFKSMAKEIYEGPMWIPQDKRVTIRKFLAQEIAKKTNFEVNDILTNRQDLIESENTKVSRLQWMLEHTMGSKGDFEYRRKELARKKRLPDTNAVNDEAVLQSYLSSVQEGGIIREYLLHGSLAFIAHKTLFVHGGILNGGGKSSDSSEIVTSLGRVPDVSTETYRSTTEWVEQLNAWYRREVQAWMDQPTWTPDHSTRGGNELLKYVLPDYPASVVMGRHLLSSGMPRPLPTEMAQLLSQNGITRLIIGHTPHGTCPTVIKQNYDEKETQQSRFQEVVMCDTSYSDMDADDNRGDAVSEVVLDPDGRVHVHGVLEDQQPIVYTTDDPFIGRALRDGTQVKAKLKKIQEQDDKYLVYSVSDGYSYTYTRRTVAEMNDVGFLD